MHVDVLRDAFGAEMPRRRQTAATPLGRRCRLAGCAYLVCLHRAGFDVSRELSLRGFVEVRGAPETRARGIDVRSPHAIAATYLL